MAIAIYTLLRVALFAVVWVAVELITPIHGVWAAAAALLMSGAISLIVLDRPRGQVGVAAGRFFGRINERIEASARAEDDEDADAGPVASGDGQERTHDDAVGEK
jgi:hypothetical protein